MKNHTAIHDFGELMYGNEISWKFSYMKDICDGFIWISLWSATVFKEPSIVKIFLLLGHGVYETNLWEELVIWSVALESLTLKPRKE